MRDYVQRLLQNEYNIAAFSNGEAALADARQQPPDLILSDVMMPGLDGFGLLQAVRSDTALQSIPFILLSARAGEEARIAGLQSGADDYLIKPFSARELLTRVSSHIRLAKIRQGTAELERKLRLDAEHLAAIVASSDDAIVSKNLDGVITSWNHSAERIFGYTAQEAIGKHITLIISPERRDEEACIIARLRQGERLDHFRTVRVRKDGTTLDVSLTISPLRDSSGRVIGASKVARDITGEIRAERQLRSSEERLRAIIETTPECVKLVAPDGTLLHMNSPGLLMVGASSIEDVVGKSVYDLIAPEDRQRYRTFNEKICAGEKGSLEFDVIGLQGARRHMESHAAPFRNQDGSIVQLAITSDVSERKRAEEVLRQHRERFDLVAQASELGFWFCDLPFDQLVWDSRVKEHFWLPPEAEVRISTFYERLHPDDRERTRQAIADSICKDVPYDVEYRTVSPTGEEKWIRAIGRTFYSSFGEPTRFDGVTLDVTAQKRAEERERQITAETVAATAKFRAVFEQTTVFAGIMTNDGVMFEANRLCLEACGFRAEEVPWENPFGKPAGGGISLSRRRKFAPRPR